MWFTAYVNACFVATLFVVTSRSGFGRFWNRRTSGSDSHPAGRPPASGWCDSTRTRPPPVELITGELSSIWLRMIQGAIRSAIPKASAPVYIATRRQLRCTITQSRTITAANGSPSGRTKPANAIVTPSNSTSQSETRSFSVQANVIAKMPTTSAAKSVSFISRLEK